MQLSLTHASWVMVIRLFHERMGLAAVRTSYGARSSRSSYILRASRPEQGRLRHMAHPIRRAVRRLLPINAGPHAMRKSETEE